jgi:hypothetical protein
MKATADAVQRPRATRYERWFQLQFRPPQRKAQGRHEKKVISIREDCTLIIVVTHPVAPSDQRKLLDEKKGKMPMHFALALAKNDAHHAR